MRSVTTIGRFHRLVLTMGCALAAGAQAQGLADGGATVVLGRYSTVSAEPPEALFRPLEVVASISFPRQLVQTVGDALQHSLVRTGYRLAEPAAADDGVARFLALPLPESQRELGPYRVRSMLDVLLGSAWSWHSDASTREVRVTPIRDAAAEPAGTARCAPWMAERHAPVVNTPLLPPAPPRAGAPG
jgi:conjugative transfer region protein (TIGR03748 family)